MTKQKLPCPFCNDRDVRSHYRRSFNAARADEWVIECHGCSCELTGFETEQDAWERWNRRAVEPTAPMPCQHLRSQFLASVPSDTYVKERHKCMDCREEFIVNMVSLPVNRTGDA